MSMSKKPLDELLYGLLPEVYRQEDSKIKPTPFPLKRFIQVASTGLEFIEGKIEGHSNIYNLDKTPEELIPHLAKMMGWEFPYDMPIDEQRNLLKSLPYLYQMKGTATVFDYLGRKVFGADSSAETVRRDYPFSALNNTSHEISQTFLLNTVKNIIDVRVLINGEVSQINEKIERYNDFADRFRPVNHYLNIIISLFYSSDYEIKVTDEHVIDILQTTDTFSKTLPNLAEYLDLTKSFDEDKYNRIVFADEYGYLSNMSLSGELSGGFYLNTYMQPFIDRILVSDMDSYLSQQMVDYSGIELVRINDSYDPLGVNHLSNGFLLNDEKSRFYLGEVYKSENISVFYKETLLDSGEDGYNKSIGADLSILDGDESNLNFAKLGSMTLASTNSTNKTQINMVETDFYNNTKTDDSFDVARVLNDRLVGFAKLNVFKLTQKEKLVYL